MAVKRLPAGVLFLGCLAFAAGYSYFATTGYRAFALSNDQHMRSLQRAIALEPRDAVPYDRLCRHLRDVESDPATAISLCQKAVQLNRYDAEYWLDLAETFYEAGNAPEQRRAIEHAIAVDPKTPQVAWNAATFYLLQGEVEPAVHLLPDVLEGDPALVPVTLRTAWQALGRVDPILRMMPPDPAVYLQFLALLTAQNQPEAAAQVWSKLIDLNTEFNYHDAMFYVDNLLAAKDVQAAEQVWTQLGERSPGFRNYGRKPENLVINGSFEYEILNAGFGWRTNPQGTKIEVDEEMRKDRGRSVLVSYSTPVLDAGLSQLIPVDPETTYTAAAWVKSEDLQTANGPRLAVFDAYTGANFAASEPTSYTTGWRAVRVQFTTGPQTRLLSLRFSRDRQDTVIRGRLWIDDVHLMRVGEQVH